MFFSLPLLWFPIWKDASCLIFLLIAVWAATLIITICFLHYQLSAIWLHLPRFTLNNRFQLQRITASQDSPLLAPKKLVTAPDQSVQILMSDVRSNVCYKKSLLLRREMLCWPNDSLLHIVCSFIRFACKTGMPILLYSHSL